MKRTEIIDEAKWLVLLHGPFRVLERGGEAFDSACPPDDPRWPYRTEILAEAVRQARRVYAFLGYNPH